MTDKFISDKTTKEIIDSLFGVEGNRKVHFVDLGGVDPFQMDSVMESVRKSFANSSEKTAASTPTPAVDGKPKQKTSEQERLLKLVGKAQELLKRLEASERAALNDEDGTDEMACDCDSRFPNKEPVNDSCKGNATTFGWFNEGFTFVTTADADNSYRTRVPVPGSRPQDVTVLVVDDRQVEVTAKIVGNNAPATTVSAEIPFNQTLVEATVENGLLTLRCESTPKAPKKVVEFPVTRPRISSPAKLEEL